MSVFCTVGATIVTYSTSGARSSSYSAVSTRAATLAEGGLNNALATIFKPGTANPVWDYVYVYGSGDPSGCDYSQLNNSSMPA